MAAILEIKNDISITKLLFNSKINQEYIDSAIAILVLNC